MKFYGLFTSVIYNAIAIFFSIVSIGIAITITEMSAQLILEPNGNRSRVIKRRCEWTLRL